MVYNGVTVKLFSLSIHKLIEADMNEDTIETPVKLSV
jgi:hypothetical protein